MQVNAGNSYSALSYALAVALGTIGEKRPKCLKVTENSMTMRDIESGDTHEIQYGKLNFEYANQLYLEDISIFNDYDFGKFFLEYGRCLFGNLMICLTKADWDAINNRDNIDVPYVHEYYDELIKLDDKLDQVISSFYSRFEFDAIIKANPRLDFAKPSDMIKEYKRQIASFTQYDLSNTTTFTIAYIALWFAVTGSILIMGKEAGYDALDQYDPRKTRSYDKLIGAIQGTSRNEDTKHRMVSMIFAFNMMRSFLMSVDGMEYEDPLLASTGSFCDEFLKAAMDTDLVNYVDEQLITNHADSGISLARFCKKYNPLVEIIEFDMNGVIQNDVTDIWEFGRTYFRLYFSPIEHADEVIEDRKLIADVSVPMVASYISDAFEGTDEGVESGFGFLKNIITGFEKARLAKIDPGLILQLTLVAAAFRKIENSGYKGLSDASKNMVAAGIDIADVIIASLFKSWFYSGKFFEQAPRAAYCEDTAVSTGNFLKAEITSIIQAYLEYVRFGVKNDGSVYKSDELAFSTIVSDRYNETLTANGMYIANKQFPTADIDTFVKECATHATRTFVYVALGDQYNPNITTEKLFDFAASATVPASVMKLLSSASIPEVTGIELVDRIIKNAIDLRDAATTDPAVYMLVVYTVLYDIVTDLFEKNNVGNYFDFVRPENTIEPYRVDTIVAEMVKKPLQMYINMSSL